MEESTALRSLRQGLGGRARGMVVHRIGLALALWIGPLTGPGLALTIALNDTGGVGVGSEARVGFEAAARLWEARLHDPVTVRLDVGFRSLDPGVLGQASSDTVGVFYGGLRTALTADRRSADDWAAIAGLENQAGFRFLTNDPLSPGDGVVFDGLGGSAIEQVLDVARANAKALGLLGDSLVADASIEFNSDFLFDFDRSNGIGSSAFDFVGIAAHEIGHALGFVSGVDIMDLVSAPGGPLAGSYSISDLAEFRIFSVLDLYRYSEQSVEIGNTLLGAPARDLTAGGTSFFSLDRGLTNLGLFSTGVFNGDGRQASHWKDFLGLGLMDPTAGQGELLSLTNLDLRALDVIGWDLASVPEPEAFFLLAIGLAGLAGVRTRAGAGV